MYVLFNLFYVYQAQKHTDTFKTRIYSHCQMFRDNSRSSIYFFSLSFCNLVSMHSMKKKKNEEHIDNQKRAVKGNKECNKFDRQSLRSIYACIVCYVIDIHSLTLKLPLMVVILMEIIVPHLFMYTQNVFSVVPSFSTLRSTSIHFMSCFDVDKQWKWYI